MTLGEAITKSLQVLNTYSIDGVPNPDTYNNQADAKLRLRAFANDAQQEIARSNGRIVREFTYATFESDFEFNTELEDPQLVHGGIKVFTANGGHSYSLNVCGSCEVNIAVGGTVVKTVTVYPTSGEFVCVKGVISNSTESAVLITVESDYDYIYKNVAIYANKYPDDDSVPEYTSSRSIAVPTDLIGFVQGQTFFNNRKSSEFRVFDRNLYLENESTGMWRFSYYAKPQEITSVTPLSYEFEVPAQIHDAIPLKMAYLSALDIQGVSGSVLTAIKNEYAQAISTVIAEPTFRTVQITNVYGV